MKNRGINMSFGTEKQINEDYAKGDMRDGFANNGATGGHRDTGNDNRKNTKKHK